MKLLLPLILIASAVLGFVLMTQPIYDEALVLKQEADKYNEALANSKILQEERDRLTQKWNNISQEDLARLEKIVPDSVDNIKLILEIQRVAQERGILVKNVQFEPEQFAENDPATQNQSANLRRPSTGDSTDYETFDMAFSIEGKYGAFVDFMKLMEKSLRLIDVKTISFTPGTSEDKDKEYTDYYQYTFRINTYRLRDL